jgi:integrase
MVTCSPASASAVGEPFQEVDPADLTSWRGDKKHAARSSPRGEAVRRRRASANRIFGILKAALNLAFREGHAASDEAWRRVKPFRQANAPKVRYLTHTETRRLVNTCDPDFRPLVQYRLPVWWDCRLPRCRFRSAAGTVSVRLSKGGRPRHIVLTEDGVALFWPPSCR